MIRSRRWTLTARPLGVPGADHLALRDLDLPDPAAGQIVLHNLYVSLDPATRKRMDAAQGYLPAIPIGGSPTTTVLGRVVSSNHGSYREGDLVTAMAGWESHSLVTVDALTAPIVDVGVPLSRHLGVLGITGLTALFGLRDVGRPAAGQTVCVSGATGGVGAIVGQIAKILGCRAVGIVGSTLKQRIALTELGYDAAVVHAGLSVNDLAAALGQAAPSGIDVVFENVGGAALDAALLNINDRARIALCGLVAGYNGTGGDACQQLWRVVVRSAVIEGFLVKSFLDRRAEGVATLTGWLKDGRLKPTEHIVDGIEAAVDAFAMLFDGRNRGKLMLRLDA
jgi:NADPH-dependent curcumin reductase CurA